MYIRSVYTGVFRVLAVVGLLFVAVAGVSQQRDDWFYGKPIRAIEFVGLVTVEESDLRPIVNPYLDRIFDLDLYFEIEGALYGTELFESLEATAAEGDEKKSTVILRLSVKEQPTIEDIVIDGERRISKGQILNAMASEPEGILNSRRLEEDLEAIRDLYEADGFGSVRVVSTVVPDEANNRATVSITVTEGIRTIAVEIAFSGNQFASDGTLRSKMSTRERALLQRGLFSERVFQRDLESIVSYYQSNGYVDVSIDRVERSIEQEVEGEQDLLSLTLHLTEGRTFEYGGTQFVGNTVFTDEELLALVRHRKDRSINLATIGADYARVQDLYYENGYIFNQFDQSLIRDTVQGTMLVQVSITERDGAHIENVRIAGNVKTRDHVLRRELPFEVGDVFNRTEVLRGLQNLYNLQYFSSVEAPTPAGSAPGLMDINITVEESTTADIGFGASFSGGDFPLSGFVRWSERNFAGLGQTVSVDLSASQLRQAVSLSFHEPWLFGKPWSAGITVGGEHAVIRGVAQDILYPVFTDSETEYAVPDPFISEDDFSPGTQIPDQYTMEYDTFAISAEVSSGYRLDTLWGRIILRGGFGSSLDFLVYDPETNRPYDKLIRDEFGRWSVVNSLWVGVAWDRRDFFLNPSKGTLLSQRVTLTGGPLSGERHYIGLDSKAEAFAEVLSIPVSDFFDLKFILAGHSGFSVILPQLRSCDAVQGVGHGLCWDELIGQENLLIIDGTTVARGWEPVFNGQALWENKIELRVPIDSKIMWGVLFFDAALLWPDRSSIRDTSLDDIYFSAGFGLRFAVPQLPLRLYLAKPFAFQDGRLGDPIGSQNAGPLGGMNLVLGLGGDTF